MTADGELLHFVCFRASLSSSQKGVGIYHVVLKPRLYGRDGLVLSRSRILPGCNLPADARQIQLVHHHLFEKSIEINAHPEFWYVGPNWSCQARSNKLGYYVKNGQLVLPSASIEKVQSSGQGLQQLVLLPAIIVDIVLIPVYAVGIVVVNLIDLSKKEL